MFTKEKVIDQNRIRDAITEKQSMTFENLKKTIVEEFLAAQKTLEENGIINKQPENNEINMYDLYEGCFSTIIFKLTLDELEFINSNNLFGIDRNNPLDCICQKVIDTKIENSKQTIQDLTNNISAQNIERYFRKFGDIHNQAKQCIKLNFILGLDRENIELTPLGNQLKACLDNIRNMEINYFKTKASSKSKR